MKHRHGPEAAASLSSTKAAAAAALTVKRGPGGRAVQPALLWQLRRLGVPSLSPCGRWVVAGCTHHDAATHLSHGTLWRFATAAGGPPPQQLTHAGEKDGQPAWSPCGRYIAFIARRRQAGVLDAAPQLYTLPAAGGEATRRSDLACGIESFKWLPDGSGLVVAAWVWPGLKGAGASATDVRTAQNAAHRAHTERKDSGYATSEAFYRYWDRNLPAGRVLRLMLLQLATGAITDLFADTPLELPRDDSHATAYDIHPGGRRIAFQFDPAAAPRLGNRCAIGEVTLDARGRRKAWRLLAGEQAWSLTAPAWSPDGRLLALLAAHQAQHHQAPPQLALLREGQAFSPAALCVPAWDFEAEAPLRWAADGARLFFVAEQRGRRPLWQVRLLPDGSAAAPPEVLVPGGWVQGFDSAEGVLVTSADSHSHPARLYAHCVAGTAPPGQPGGQPAPPRRLDRFNDRELARASLGAVHEVLIPGAQGTALQLWLTFPPDFDPRRPHGVMHVIHGGPHAAAGDTFSYRWNPHVLASRGHVVAQVNYHGSSGFGFEFKRSLVGRQGELELQDIEAATGWLLQQPWCDRRRVFATGGSYGGFLVAWMNGHVPAGRYRAYVCHAGVFDRVATFSADSYAVRPKDLGANWWDAMPRVLAQSPHAFAARMGTPTLVIHGAHDFRVPDCNGLAYYNTLQAMGVPARLLWFPDENHWVLKPANSLQWYREFLDWIAAHDLPAARRARAGVRSAEDPP
jgi:dipeptidyl aminopeptidase/acylaminoacyl peptidase